MKLLTQQSGNVTRTCSRRCYDADATTRCACICGGRNHAVGITRALANVQTLFLPQKDLKDAGKGIPQVTRAAERALRRTLEAL